MTEDTGPQLPILRNLHSWILAQQAAARPAPVTTAVRSDFSGWDCSCGAGVTILAPPRAVTRAAREHSMRCGTEPDTRPDRGTAQVLLVSVVCLVGAAGAGAIARDWLLTSLAILTLAMITAGTAGRWRR